MMTYEHPNFSITGMDANNTYKDPDSAHHHVSLTLSGKPSPAWAEDFNETWANHFNMMKRHALVQGDSIVVKCMLNEVNEGLSAELSKVIEEVNKRQQQLVKEAALKEQQKKEAQKADEMKIAEAAAKFNQQ